MKEPLISFDMYEDIKQLKHVGREQLKTEVKELMKDMENNRPLSYTTLKFCIEFFREVVERHDTTLMTSYNISITVGPNIFRPRYMAEDDLFDAGHFYEVLRMLIENYDFFFNDINVEQNNAVKSNKLMHGAVGTMSTNYLVE